MKTVKPTHESVITQGENAGQVAKTWEEGRAVSPKFIEDLEALAGRAQEEAGAATYGLLHVLAYLLRQGQKVSPLLKQVVDGLSNKLVMKSAEAIPDTARPREVN